MKFTFNWLKEFVTLKVAPEKLAELLTMAGIEVESLTSLREPGTSQEDWLFEIAVTPNRGDCLGIAGVAREVSALIGGPLKTAKVSAHAKDPGMAKRVSVEIKDRHLCPRYSARIVDETRVEPSPAWMRFRLETSGVRSINNVVDATNYVMLETGQPLHAFDYHLLAKVGQASSLSEGTQDTCPTIVIRRARPGEKFTTLDGQEHSLTNDMLLIADEQKAVALAGVMGGKNSEINETTRDVLIECACFQPTNIRRTSKALGLRTEASYRFERGADVGITDWASQRCAQLILDTAGGQLAEGVVDAYPQPAAPREITLRHAKVGELLGVPLRPEEIEYYLGQLGLKVTHRRPRPVGAEIADLEPATFRIPTFRVDLKRETDLIEEVCRLYGVDKIPATPPRGAIGSNAYDAVHDQIAEARRILTGLGLNEAKGQTLMSKSDVRGAKIEELVTLANPLSSAMDVLRPTLIPGLLDALRHNLHHKTGDVALFEIGRVFQCAAGVPPSGRQDADGVLKEKRHLAIAITGRRQPPFWGCDNRDAKLDLYDMKGLLEEFLDQFGLRGLIWTRRVEGTPLFLESALVQLGGRLTLGELGQLSPLLAKQYDLRDAVLLAELDFDALLARRNPSKSFKALPQFPGIRRDVAMLVPKTTTHEAVLNVVRQTRLANLESVELFDVFRGGHVPAGEKSMAYALTYRHAERTLTDAEVNAEQEKLVEQFKQKLRATIR